MLAPDARRARSIVPAGRQRLTAAEHELYLSAASAWEIALKRSLGRLHLPMDPAEYDPFDRLPIAQAQIEGLVVMTSDPQFSAYAVEVIGP